jgi:hypothetical protein
MNIEAMNPGYPPRRAPAVNKFKSCVCRCPIPGFLGSVLGPVDLAAAQITGQHRPPAEHMQRQVAMVIVVTMKLAALLLPVCRIRTHGTQQLGRVRAHHQTPPGTPGEIVLQLNGIFLKAVRTEAMKGRLNKLGLHAAELTPAQLAALVKADYERWIPAIKASGVSLQ